MNHARSRREFLTFLAASPLLAGFPRSALLEAFAQNTTASTAAAGDVIAAAKDALNVFDFEAVAKKNLPPAHWGYMASGVDDDATLRANREAFGHRMLMDFIVPGGVAGDLPPGSATALQDQCTSLAREIKTLHDIYDDHAGLQDRFRTCGRVTPELAEQLGLEGLAGRASGQAYDARCDFAVAPYDALSVNKMTKTEGDVAARVAIRFDEVLESLRLILAILDALPDGPIAVPFPDVREHQLGLGYVEGWRGPVLIALTSGPDGSIRRCHPHDPSWTNWPVLEHAVIGNIVPDFPLINKSFNLAYSGHDL